MSTPALRFHEQPYDLNRLGNLLLQFRTNGYVVLPDLFERESVDAFLAEVQTLVKKDERGRWSLPDDQPAIYWPIRAPRLKAILQGALSYATMAPNVQVFETAWLILDSGQQGVRWHKDRQHEGWRGRDYHYPECVHVGMYFRDTELEDGPTAIIPGSHVDQTLSPYTSDARIEHMLPRKQDAVLWDQRCWHAATPRQKEGLRIFALFGFQPIQAFGNYPLRHMPRALVKAWLEAEGTPEEAYFGGPWSARSVIEGIKAAQAAEPREG
jgi:hypothetical protein